MVQEALVFLVDDEVAEQAREALVFLVDDEVAEQARATAEVLAHLSRVVVEGRMPARARAPWRHARAPTGSAPV